MDKISVLIYTYNQENEIDECIDSALQLTSDVVVIDMESTDRTREIASAKGAKIYTFPHTDYVEPSREFGISHADSQWIFILDSDERMTQELAEEMRENIEKNTFTYYKVPRKNIFGKKKWLKHGGWWPDMQMRLIKKDSFISWSKNIHSTPVIKGEIGFLHSPFLHYFHGDIERMVEKTSIFEDIESDLLYKAGRNVKTITFFRKYVAELYRRLLQKMGFMDGTIGIIESIYQAYSKTITYLFLYEKKNNRSL